MSDREQDIDHWLATVLPELCLQREPASDDASFRRYFRITGDDGRSRILMDAPPDLEDCRPFVDVAGRLRRAGVNVPDILAQDLHRGFLLLEDMGSTAYLQRLGPESAPELYRDALVTLVRMQRQTETHALPVYDARRLHQEMDLFHQWFLPRHLGVVLDSRQMSSLRCIQNALAEACLGQPQVFVHRDYHSRNLMVLPRHNPGVLDFQDALVGPLTYDLVSLLRDVYVEWPDEEVRRWVSLYGTLAREQGMLEEEHARQLMRWFDLTGVQRHLKVAGIFARLFYRDSKPRYLADLPLTLRYLERICERYSELTALAQLLRELDVQRASARASAPHLARARQS